MKEISNDVSEINTLYIEISYTKLEIKTATKFKVETNNNNISFEENNGNIKISEADKNLFKLNNTNNNSVLTIYLPEDMKLLDDVKLETGAGDVKIDKLDTQKLNLEVGAGKVEITNSEIHNMEANLGAGEFNFNGKLIGNNKINAGVGEIAIKLNDEIENYSFDISKGIGNVTLNGNTVYENKIYGSGDNYIKINGGIGNVKIENI